MKSLKGQIVWKNTLYLTILTSLSLGTLPLLLSGLSEVEILIITLGGIISLSVLFVLLYRSYNRIALPINSFNTNVENALNSKTLPLSVSNTNIIELQKMESNALYLLEMLKQKYGSAQNAEKVAQFKNFNGELTSKRATNEAEKFKLAVDSAPESIIIVDKFGYINYANKAFTNLIGIEFQDAENKKITELWHKEDDQGLWKENYESVSKNKKSVTFASQGTKKNNLSFESMIQISPIKNSDDTVESFLVIERDVTEEKQKERLKSEFISVVSHELRTPMTIIRGYSSLLSEGKLGELNPKQKEYIDKINTETGQLLELANDMLDIQKFESGKIDLKFEKTDMEQFVTKIVQDFQMQFEKKGLGLSFENNSTSKFSSIDHKYFTRVITNLLTNAYKYTIKGEVKVFLVNPDAQHVVIAVKDTGVGIKEAALNHLFERFYQADGVMQRKQEGSGLGLSIVKRVAESHGGMVWVESVEGTGSTFYVALPVA